MIITQTPFRISFAGGGSDLAEYYSRETGAVLTTAIDRYMYLTVKERFGATFRVSYSRTELVETAEQVQHPIVREALRDLAITQGLEIVSIGDLPAEAGMGSSSAFTVGLLHALHAHEGRTVTPGALAEQACRIEIDKLGEPIGKQDQYIAAYGGLQYIEFHPDGRVSVDPVICPPGVRDALQARLALFFTGTTRAAREILTRQRANTEARRPSLRRLCDVARRMRDVLTRGTGLDDFGHLLHEAWETKKSLEGTISTPRIDVCYERGRRAGALGGKLLGAGQGGFLLFYCDPAARQGLRDALKDLLEVPMALEPRGTRIVFVGGDRR